MKIYRILRITEKSHDVTKVVNIKYFIQRRYLFIFWVNVHIKTHYYTHTDWNKRPMHGALLTRRNLIFTSEYHARHVIDRLKSDSTIYYRGCRIIRVFDDINVMNDHYINLSHSRIWNESLCYEWSSSLDDLKEEIDKRVVHKVRTVIQ